MSFGSDMRALATELILENGEDALFTSVTLIDVLASGTVTESGSPVAVKAFREESSTAYANDGQDVALKTFQSGTLQVKSTEKVLISGASLSSAPKPGDRLTWGTSDVAANRRRVIRLDTERPQGISALYTIVVEK